jgi:hypothetical protein
VQGGRWLFYALSIIRFDSSDVHHVVRLDRSFIEKHRSRSQFDFFDFFLGQNQGLLETWSDFFVRFWKEQTMNWFKRRRVFFSSYGCCIVNWRCFGCACIVHVDCCCSCCSRCVGCCVREILHRVGSRSRWNRRCL